MDRQEVPFYLFRMEQEFPVEQWASSDIDLWPLIRLDLYYMWYNLHFPKVIDPSKLVIIKSIAGRAESVLRSFVSLLKLYISKAGNCPILFSGAATYRVDFKDHFINRFYQPLQEHLQGQGVPFISVEYSARVAGKVYPETSDLFFLDKYRPAAKLLLRLRKKDHWVAPGFESFIDSVNAALGLTLTSEGYKNRLLKKVRDVRVNALVYALFLKKYKVRTAIGLCYYNGAMLGMNYAAWKAGIVSIDLQHGTIGESTVPYAAFNKVPDAGYSVLPKTFWCWDSFSRSIVDQWTSRQVYHNAVAGGNPWLQYAVANSTDYEFPEKKIVLYTMQFEEPEPHIFEAIRLSDDSLQWWLRLHPRKLSGKQAIIGKLQQMGIAHKVNIEAATAYPLPVILQHCFIHISRYSGAVIEAAQTGVSTILIDDLGVSTYTEQIENRTAIACTGTDAVVLLENIVAYGGITRDNAQVIDFRPTLAAFL